ncbi:CIC11C00000001558 [Sungouiella intermedia]|uniref:CIC11C00000001558 n=1 Tax=Sungouiella intermedia TaxID=45354 RepID=A0A1L0CX35_9ASCO|nr:CIC11C00000001558 [[Candida] intermedia]
MFNKIKLRKAPLSLSSVSNAIKSSGTSNLTPEVSPKHLKVTAGDQLGLPVDSIAAIAYDPVQSLLAVGTTNNTIHVYGQSTVEVVFGLKSLGSVSHLRFVKGVYLVCVETSGSITVLSLESKEILGHYLAHGTVCAVESDPSLDWLVVGLNNGSLIFYDVDRLTLTPFRVDNLQKVVMPKQKMSPVLSIEWHPRDIGSLLISYSHCVVQYSIASGGIKNAFIYQLDPSCRGFEYSNLIETGGKKKLFGSPKEVCPRVIEAHYHPNGLHVVTVHADGTLAFWDSNSATLLEARTTKETGLHKQGQPAQVGACGEMRARWITGQDPELTLLLVTGATAEAPDVIDILDFGYTLKYSMTSHEKQGEFYRKPQEGQRKIHVKFNRRLQEQGPLEYITHLLPLAAEAQPYFNGSHNPSKIFLLSSLGALYMSSLNPLSPPDMTMPPSLATILPPLTFSSSESVKRVNWFSILSNRRAKGAPPNTLLSGGAASNKLYPRSIGLDEGYHTVSIKAHENGSVCLLDVTSGEYNDDESIVQINLKDTLDNGTGSSSYRPSIVSCSFESREMLVGLANGNVAICKFTKAGVNPPSRSGYDQCAVQHSNGNAKIIDLSRRILGNFSQPSFMPVSLLQTESSDRISCLKLTDAGFAAVGYKSGRLVVCDISRGPAVIMNLENITRHLPSVSGECYVTSLEFSIMEYGQDGYSSLLLFVGTNSGGNLMTFKIVPQSNGAFDVSFADKTLGLNYRSKENEDSRLDEIMPINAATGESAVATLEMFRALARNIVIPGYVVVSSKRDLRVLKTPKQKLAHKVVDETCVSCGIVNIRPKGIALAALTETGFVKLFSLPSLGDVADIKLPVDIYKKLQNVLKGRAAQNTTVISSGEIIVLMNSSETLNLLIYDESKNKSLPKTKPTDLLFNKNAIIPPRPTAGALLWAKGQASYISSQDLASLIAGPNRKPAKHSESELAYNISPEANPNMSYGAYAGAMASKESEKAYEQPVRRATSTNPYAFGTGGFMKTMRDGLDAVEEGMNQYASGLSESMNETVESLKRSFYSLAIKSKFGV